MLQRGICLLLGSAIIIDALTADKPLEELIIGCIVIGVLPVDSVVEFFRPRRRTDDD